MIKLTSSIKHNIVHNLTSMLDVVNRLIKPTSESFSKYYDSNFRQPKSASIDFLPHIILFRGCSCNWTFHLLQYLRPNRHSRILAEWGQGRRPVNRTEKKRGKLNGNWFFTCDIYPGRMCHCRMHFLDNNFTWSTHIVLLWKRAERRRK